MIIASYDVISNCNSIISPHAKGFGTFMYCIQVLYMIVQSIIILIYTLPLVCALAGDRCTTNKPMMSWLQEVNLNSILWDDLPNQVCSTNCSHNCAITYIHCRHNIPSQGDIIVKGGGFTCILQDKVTARLQIKDHNVEQTPGWAKSVDNVMRLLLSRLFSSMVSGCMHTHVWNSLKF